jgi:hypothetical protein
VTDSGGGGLLGCQRGEFSDFGLLGCDTAYCGRHCGTTSCFEVVFRKGVKRKEENAVGSGVEASRHLALTAPSDYDGSLWDVTSCKGTRCLRLKL